MVSIIIPAYNAGRYLRECLDSALAQSHRDVEVIVVDDGSTDLTPSILVEYRRRDPRMRVLTQPNSGVSAARNAALRIARGEWITFLDSDDALYSHSIATMLRVAEQTGCDLVYGGWKGGRYIPTVDIDRDFTTEIRDQYSVIEEVLYQSSDIVPAPWGKLYKRSCLDGISFEHGCIYEDLDMFYKLRPRGGKIAVTGCPVYFYRDNPGSITNTFSPSRLDVLKVTGRIEAAMSAATPQLQRAARDRRLSANFNMFCLLALHDRHGDFDDVSRECWRVIKSYRRESLADPRVRMKNKLGILASYGGRWMLRLLSPLVYGRKMSNGSHHA
ncbi:MAG: glycosyltransferase [Bacteroides sp.]|nr:glycosyltransferase [Bacteroides sp.]